MRLTSHRSFACRPLLKRMAIVVLTVAIGSGQPAWALITGGEGNKPIGDPGWPAGAAAVFNTEHRVAYWEGPPLGGGQYYSECRGDGAALEQVLEDFAKIDTPKKRVVLHDGVGRSFWLNPNREKEKAEKAQIDWVFMVWQPDRLKFQQGLPAGLRAVQQQDDVMLAQLDVYTGGAIRWSEITVPDGIDIVDQRLEAHGYTLEDGTVLEGTAIDLATKQPISGELILERIKPQKQGGYQYTKLVEATTDADGRWVIKQAPQGWCRLVLTADGYVSRVIGFGNFDDQPRWSEHNSGLSKPGIVMGRVVDDQQRPLADVDVRVGDLAVENAGRYQLPDGDVPVQTDADGRFEFKALPLGSATVRVHKPGYVRPGLGLKIKIPSDGLELQMKPAATLLVRVDFSATVRPNGYIIHIEPEGGEAVGKWSGDANIDAKDQFTFENIPPGRYVVTGRPNPGNEAQTTSPLTLDLKGGKTAELTIKAK